jgi:hypothetical protein
MDVPMAVTTPAGFTEPRLFSMVAGAVRYDEVCAVVEPNWHAKGDVARSIGTNKSMSLLFAILAALKVHGSVAVLPAIIDHGMLACAIFGDIDTKARIAKIARMDGKGTAG